MQPGGVRLSFQRERHNSSLYSMKGRLTGYSAPSGERAEWRYDHLGRAFAQVVFDAQGQVSSANMTIRNDNAQILATLSPRRMGRAQRNPSAWRLSCRLGW
jgi:YD repeat-containing protein